MTTPSGSPINAIAGKVQQFENVLNTLNNLKLLSEKDSSYESCQHRKVNAVALSDLGKPIAPCAECVKVTKENLTCASIQQLNHLFSGEEQLKTLVDLVRKELAENHQTIEKLQKELKEKNSRVEKLDEIEKMQKIEEEKKIEKMQNIAEAKTSYPFPKQTFTADAGSWNRKLKNQLYRFCKFTNVSKENFIESFSINTDDKGKYWIEIDIFSKSIKESKEYFEKLGMSADNTGHYKSTDHEQVKILLEVFKNNHEFQQAFAFDNIRDQIEKNLK